MVDATSQVEFLRQILNSIPSLVFVVDSDVRVEYLNNRSTEFLKIGLEDVYHQRGGDVFGCRHRLDHPDGCGSGPHCVAACVVRHTVEEVFTTGEMVYRRRFDLDIGDGESSTKFIGLITATPSTYDSEPIALMTIEDYSEVALLQGLIPICAQCKKVRCDESYWQTIDQYLANRTAATFSHGLCPTCAEAAMAEIDDIVKARETESADSAS